MLLIGEFISAEETRPQGRANRVLPAVAFDNVVDAMVHSILGKPQAASALGKALFYKQQGVGFDAAYQLASQAIAVNRMPPVAPKSVRALIEKRRAQWPAAVY